MLPTGAYSSRHIWRRLGDGQDPEEGRQLRCRRALQEPGLRRAHAATVLHDGHFYSHYTINERSNGLVAMSMDGQIKWKTDQQPPFVRGGSVLADGLLLTTDRNTKLYLIEPSPSGFKPLASAVILEPGNNWAPLALADGTLLVRGQKELKALRIAE